MVGHVAGDDRAEDADGGDDRGAVAAPLLRQGFLTTNARCSRRVRRPGSSPATKRQKA
jgi:hypothetical protein